MQLYRWWFRMAQIAERADRFVRSVFKPTRLTPPVEDPKKDAEVKERRARLMEIRRRIVRRRRGA